MAAPTDPDFLRLQSAVAGRFSLERELGRGGMGVVYLARDVLLERAVAIKLLAPQLARRPDMRSRFVREARIAAQCFHPHIVPIHAVEEAGDLAWFVMAFVDGETLAERLRRAGPLPPAMVRRLGREIGWALSYAHERGVVHRDVKPENILLEAGTDRALIADFGIALRDGADADGADGQPAGTARYMAPEQAQGTAIDGRADLYALGLTLWVAATGRHPFTGTSALALLAQHAATPVPPVRSAAPGIPTDVGDAIDRCCAKRPEDRFATVAEFVRAIAPHRDVSPPPAALLPVIAGARTTHALAGWTVAAAVAAPLLVLGEPDRLGKAITGAVGNTIVALLAASAALRGAETLVQARRALRRGVRAGDVARALSAAPPDDDRPAAAVRSIGHRVVAGVTLAGLGAALAFAQGRTNALAWPTLLENAVNFSLFVLPPFLIGRGATLALRDSAVAGWVQQRIAAPVARALTRWLGGRAAAPSAAPLQSAEATELRLEHAAESLFARLPAGVRAQFTEVPDAAAALAREAEALRRLDARLADEQRRLRASRGTDRATDAAMASEPAEAGLSRIDRERLDVQGRLATVIAALDTMRVELLRLDAGADDLSGLTTQLAVVRDLQRRVDAASEVRRLLAPGPAPELTPA